MRLCLRPGGREICEGGAFRAEGPEEAIDARRGEVCTGARSHVELSAMQGSMVRVQEMR